MGLAGKFGTLLFLLSGIFWGSLNAQTLFKPDRVFDGTSMQEGWVVVVEGELISFAGPASGYKGRPKSTVELKGKTLMPGMIEGHAHLFLYPYNQTAWEVQVLKESESYRTARATRHAWATLKAGFTTVRDLGTEGAGYADAGLKRAIEEGIIPGPRLIIAGPALVATASYAPFGYSSEIEIHKGAEESDGDDLIRTTREQIGKGADFIKIYADYR